MTTYPTQTSNVEKDLFHKSYSASLAVIRSVAPFLSRSNGSARLRKGATTVPRLIAAALLGIAPSERRVHALLEAGFLCREMLVILSFCRDLHSRFINSALCSELIETYRSIDAEILRHVDGGRGKLEAAS